MKYWHVILDREDFGLMKRLVDREKDKFTRVPEHPDDRVVLNRLESLENCLHKAEEDRDAD